MANKISRAIVITIGTAVAGLTVKEGAVLLVPEDIGEDAARTLMRMARPRAVAASEDQAGKRLAEFKKAKAKREAEEKEQREEAEAIAQLEADELAQLQQEAEEKAGEIVAAAEEEAKKIIAAAKAGAGENVSSEMRAKMRVAGIESHGENSETLRLSAVCKPGAYPEDGLDEDNTFATFTPSAELTILINNPALVGKFKEGDAYYLDFTKAVEPKAKAKGK